MSMFDWLFGDETKAYEAGVERAKGGKGSALSPLDKLTLYDDEKAAQHRGFENAREAMTHAEILAERLKGP